MAIRSICCLLLLAGQTSLDLANNADVLLRPGQSAESEDKIGFLFAVLGETTGAHQHFRKAIALDGGYAPAHYHLGAADWVADVKQEGTRELETAVRLAPANFEYRYRLGVAYLELADFDKAAEQLKQAVTLHGATEPAWKSLGQGLRSKGE